MFYQILALIYYLLRRYKIPKVPNSHWLCLLKELYTHIQRTTVENVD